MNSVGLSGRLTADPEIRSSAQGKMIAYYTLAVDGYGKDAPADFIRCVAFDKRAEFAESYLHKGMKIIVNGRLHVNSYTNRDGQKVNTYEVIVLENEFCESRPAAPAKKEDEWMMPDDYIGDEGLPFN